MLKKASEAAPQPWDPSGVIDQRWFPCASSLKLIALLIVSFVVWRIMVLESSSLGRKKPVGTFWKYVYRDKCQGEMMSKLGRLSGQSSTPDRNRAERRNTANYIN